MSNKTTPSLHYLNLKIMKIGIVFSLALFVQVHSEEDYYASITQLEDVYNREGRMVSQLENLIDELQENFKGLKETIQQMKERRTTVTDVSQFLQNPINSFVYVRSLNEYITNVTKSLEPIKDIQKLFEENETSGGWPSRNDVEGAAKAILRLQSTYKLDIDRLIQGKIYNRSSIPLDIHDCLTIAEAAYLKGSYEEANIWSQKALELCDRPGNGTVCDTNYKINITEDAAYVQYISGNLVRALELTNIILKLEPNHKRAENNKKYLTDEINNVPQSQRTGEFMLDSTGNIDHEKHYIHCCRGLAHPKPQIIFNLKCRYVHYNNPYLMIGPIKVEEASSEPKIVLIRDIIFDSEILEIQNISKSFLERSKTQGDPNDEIRVSKVAWLMPEASELVDKLERRFSIYSDLSAVSAEPLQVVNYGLGGHYLAHLDAFSEKQAVESWGSLGNRIATLLLYMNEVEEGGATVFTALGVHVKPEKGVAVLWYNLLNDGSQDLDTLHAACPVLLGTKWAINLWFHEANNEFTKPCRPRNLLKPLRFV